MEPKAPQPVAKYSPEWLDEIFSYHQPTDSQRNALEEIRLQAKRLAWTIIQVCPDSADRSAALRQVRDAAMTANQAVVLNGLV